MTSGSAGQTTTTTPGMQAAASSIDGTISTIQGIVGNVQSSVDSLMGSWSGEAATAFKSSCEPWFSDARRILQALEAQSEALTSNRNLITAAEAEQQQSAQQLANQVAVNF